MPRKECSCQGHLHGTREELEARIEQLSRLCNKLEEENRKLKEKIEKAIDIITDKE